MIALNPLPSAALVALALTATTSAAQRRPPTMTPAVGEVRYEVTFDAETAAERTIHVEMTFTVDGDGPVELSIPAWTPGSYSLDDFARNIRGFEARAGEAPIRWDKSDFDTWRVYPESAGPVRVAFDYRAEELDVGMSWATDDFAFFNGTNLLPYPEDEGLDFEATVTVHTEPDWAVATGLTRAGEGWRYRADSYHELVDMPTVIGRFEADTRVIDGRIYHLATYPADAMSPTDRRLFWDQVERMLPPMTAVFGETPWEEYTTLLVFDPDFPGGSALEHANSHLGIYANVFIGTPLLASITAHEIFHAWNVKRLRPAELWPYEYSRPQPTELLWISEGVTDYYADLALVRGGIVSPNALYDLTNGKIQAVLGSPPVALEDASLTTWISPTDGTSMIYYQKGSLAGFALDIVIRDATDNGASLDDVLRRVYEDTYKRGAGFTEEQWWAAVEAVAPGVQTDAFHDAYVDGREPFAWDQILPLAGLAIVADTARLPRIGIFTQSDSIGEHVTAVVPGGAADDAGVLAEDRLVRVGDIDVTPRFGEDYRARYGRAAEGTRLEIVVERGGRELTLPLELRFADNVTASIVELPNAPPRAVRVRRGILQGLVDR